MQTITITTWWAENTEEGNWQSGYPYEQVHFSIYSEETETIYLKDRIPPLYFYYELP